MREKALIVGANINQSKKFKESLEELKNLALACDLEIVGVVEQNVKVINNKFLIGKGKVEEVNNFKESLNADLIIFSEDLSPVQLKNLEKTFGVIVIDRTNLILEIFDKRAKTKEARMQVELAHLEYMLPRLVGSYEHLGRQSGGVGTKNKGVGEKKLELDRRKIEDEIALLKEKLESISNTRKIQRKRRKKTGINTVALVGYTNAGKSSIMNSILSKYGKDEDKKVWVKDQLFATLDTSVRSIDLEDNKNFLLSDTVGFVSKLPHSLVKAFRSTLEEAIEADLILHVVDYSNEEYREQIKITNDTLEEIGVKGIPIIYIFNKSDLVDIEIPFEKDDKVYISAKEDIGIDLLIEKIKKELFSSYIRCKMLIPFDKGDIVSRLNENSNVINIEYKEDGTLLDIECSQKDYNKYINYLKE